MRLANVKGRLTTFIEGQPVDVEEASGGRFSTDVQSGFDSWNELMSWGRVHGAHGTGTVAETELDAPVPAPRQVFGVGLNYRDHAAEGNIELPTSPTVFAKFPSCITGPRTPVEVVSDTTDWEVELVVVIGEPGHHVRAADAWHHVGGLTIGQDISERSQQLAGPIPQFSLAKSYPGFGPVGPWLVTADELGDPDDLPIRCTIDGEVVQQARTSDMVFSVSELIEHISSVCPLLPGDLIFTGTPAGVGNARSPKRFLAAGQVVVSEIDGIGRLTTTMTARTPQNVLAGDRTA